MDQRSDPAISRHGIRLQRLLTAVEYLSFLCHQGRHRDYWTGSDYWPAVNDLSPRWRRGDGSHADPVLWVSCRRSTRIGNGAGPSAPVASAAPGHEHSPQTGSAVDRKSVGQAGNEILSQLHAAGNDGLVRGSGSAVRVGGSLPVEPRDRKSTRLNS